MKNQQRHFFTASLALLFPLVIVVWCCTKPTKDFVININSNIISYTATFDFTDAKTGLVPQGLAVSVEGADAASIYDYSGTKQLKINSGKVTVGVTPHSNPTGTTVLSFSLKATGTNYLPVNIPVTIGSNNLNQNFAVPLVSTSNPPDGAAVRVQTNSIQNGTTTTAIAVTTTTNASTTTTATVTIPAGTQLRNAANAVIAGGSASSIVASFDPGQPSALLQLPGGQVQTNVSGGSSPTVFFQPAGFATIIMNVGNTEVKNFSQPVAIQIGLNANTFNPVTNATIKAGDQLDIYSYQVETGIWKYENAATITSSGGKLYANFSINHLCSFLANVRNQIQPCTGGSTLTFSAPSISAKSSEQFIVDIIPTGAGANPAPVLSQYVTIHDKDRFTFRRVPAGNVRVRVSLVDYNHYKLNDYNNRGTIVSDGNINFCAAGEQGVTLNINYAPGTYLTGTGVAVCPNDNTKVYLPPNGAQIYYRRTGSNDQLRILGVIVDESVTTSQLVIGQRYDMFGNYAGKQVGRTNILIREGVSFLDSTHIINNGSSFCP